MKIRNIRIINTVTFAGMIAINALANILPMGIGTTGDVSAKYQNLFTPSPITFIIWSMIYVFMGAYVLYSWGIFEKKEQSRKVSKKIGLWFPVTCILNGAWIFAWHYDVIWLSVILMAGLLVSLGIINNKLRTIEMNSVDKAAASAGFQVYFGWIIAATIANISTFLVSINWNGFGISPVVWTCIVISVGGIIGTVLAIARGKYLPTLAIIWAYAGILIRQISESGLGESYFSIILTTIIAISVMVIGIFAAYVKNCSYQSITGCHQCEYIGA